MLVGMFHQDIGPSQLIALPKDSYLLDYFSDVNTYSSKGPPLYFVIKDGYDYTSETNQNKVLFVHDFLLFVWLMFINFTVFRSALHLAVTIIQ